MLPLKRLSLTDVKIEGLPRSSKDKNLKASWKDQEVLKKWESSAWARKLAAKKARSDLSDFGRFKVMIAKKQKSEIIARKVKELSK